MKQRRELLEKIEMSEIFLDEAQNDLIPVAIQPFHYRCLVNMETGEEIYRVKSQYYYFKKTDTEFYEMRDGINRLRELINTKTRIAVTPPILAITFFVSKDYLFICGERSIIIYGRRDFRLLAHQTEYFDEDTIRDSCYTLWTVWNDNIFIHSFSYQGKPYTSATLAFTHKWGSVFFRFTYDEKGKIFEPIELFSEDAIDPASLSKDMKMLSKTLESKEYLEW